MREIELNNMDEASSTAPMVVDNLAPTESKSLTCTPRELTRDVVNGVLHLLHVIFCTVVFLHTTHRPFSTTREVGSLNMPFREKTSGQAVVEDTELNDKMKEEIMGMVTEKFNQMFNIRMEAVHSRIGSINSRMLTAESRSQSQTRKLSELDHEAESLAGTIDSIRSNQLETERIIRNITIQLGRRIATSYNVDGDLAKLNELIARGERDQNATSPEESRITLDMEGMKQEVIDSILEKLEAKEEQRTVFDVPLDNGTSTIDLHSLENSVKDLRSKVLRNTRLPMTCHEIFDRRDLVEDGTELMDEIDPDGRGKYIIRVRCFEENGRVYTEISSDAEEFINITPCDTQGCFNRKISYDAPMEAIEALIRISEGGRQEFKFSGYHAALADFGSYVGSDGESHGFSCKCGEDGSCIRSPTPVACNADALPQTEDWRLDSGVVTDMTIMPVRAMVYQYLHADYEAKMSFGPLQFFGKKSISNESCTKLRIDGDTASGFKFWESSQQSQHYLKAVFCDFTKSITDMTMEKDLGKIGLIGEWTAWEAWSPCSVTCDSGTRSRSRGHSSSRPVSGSGIETESCNVEGAWTAWGAFGACSSTCGAGKQTQTRGYTGNRPCSGRSTNIRNCIEGTWTSWNSWSSWLTNNCGLKHRQRDRSYSGGGLPCSGSEKSFGVKHLGSHRHGYQCGISLVLPDHRSNMRVGFYTFSTEKGYDKVTIAGVGAYSGSAPPTSLVLPGYQLDVTYRTDGSGDSHGFDLYLY